MHLSQPSEVGASASVHPHNPTNRQSTEVHHKLQPTHLSTLLVRITSHVVSSNLTPKLEPLLAPTMDVFPETIQPTAYVKYCNHKGRVQSGQAAAGNIKWQLLYKYFHNLIGILHHPRIFTSWVSSNPFASEFWQKPLDMPEPPLTLAKDVLYHSNVAASFCLEGSEKAENVYSGDISLIEKAFSC